LSESARKAMSLSPVAKAVVVQCDVLLPSPESGKGRGPPEHMNFPGFPHHIGVA
jgi:hypothetical protein